MGLTYMIPSMPNFYDFRSLANDIVASDTSTSVSVSAGMHMQAKGTPSFINIRRDTWVSGHLADLHTE